MTENAFNASAAWFVAAVAVDQELRPSKLFAPGASIRVGNADSNDFVIAACAVDSHLVLADGVEVRLLAGFEARMSGIGMPLVAANFETDGPVVRVIADRVNLSLWPAISLFMRYFATREEADGFIDEQRIARARDGR